MSSVTPVDCQGPAASTEPRPRAVLADLPVNECSRLAALKRYEVLDTAAEQAFDDIAYVAAALCNAPIVGTSTRRFACGFACASAIAVRILTAAALLNSLTSRTAKFQRLIATSDRKGKATRGRARSPKAPRNKLGSPWISHAVLRSAVRPRIAFISPHETAHAQLEKQNEHSGDHQREHPNQIDVEPCAAQYRDAKFFINHNRD